MAGENARNLRLGLVILIATTLLVAALYFIGSKQNLFGSTFRISAQFRNVNGLMKGNNVRVGGINVGTVESVEIVSDSAVNVVMVIKADVQQFIKKGALAIVGTDGLMGNKLININSINDSSPAVKDGDILQTLRPVEMDEMMSTLSVTNENMRDITNNFKSISEKLNSKNNLWNLLLDTVLSHNVKSSVVNLKLMSDQAVSVTGNLKIIIDDVKKGKGTIGALITDTLLSSKIRQTVVNLEKISDTAGIITGNISHIVNQLKQGKGTMGVLLNDTTLISNLKQTMGNLKVGSENLNENIEALRYSWPFKKYFKQQKKSNLKN
ncbi:MAG: MlaD family protein [Bacteroidia bacterium]